MESKDTVMSNDRIVLREVRIPTGDSIGGHPVVRVEKEIDADATLLAQAEITWNKAIGEVVEWGNEYCDCDVIREHPVRRHFCPRCWQAKLKDWGIKEGK